MSILCRLGWHDWTRWTVKILRKISTQQEYRGQVRECKRCGLEDLR